MDKLDISFVTKRGMAFVMNVHVVHKDVSIIIIIIIMIKLVAFLVPLHSAYNPRKDLNLFLLEEAGY